MLIVHIKRLRKEGKYPSLLFQKMGEEDLSKAIKDKYDAFIGKMGLDVKNISNKEVNFTT
jgi:hypothetical protein